MCHVLNILSFMSEVGEAYLAADLKELTNCRRRKTRRHTWQRLLEMLHHNHRNIYDRCQEPNKWLFGHTGRNGSGRKPSKLSTVTHYVGLSHNSYQSFLVFFKYFGDARKLGIDQNLNDGDFPNHLVEIGS